MILMAAGARTFPRENEVLEDCEANLLVIPSARQVYHMFCGLCMYSTMFVTIF